MDGTLKFLYNRPPFLFPPTNSQRIAEYLSVINFWTNYKNVSHIPLVTVFGHVACGYIGVCQCQVAESRILNLRTYEVTGQSTKYLDCGTYWFCTMCSSFMSNVSTYEFGNRKSLCPPFRACVLRILNLFTYLQRKFLLCML